MLEVGPDLSKGLGPDDLQKLLSACIVLLILGTRKKFK